jgi:hypothetical protein
VGLDSAPNTAQRVGEHLPNERGGAWSAAEHMTVEKKGREKIETQGGGELTKHPENLVLLAIPLFGCCLSTHQSWQLASHIIISVKSFRVALTTYWW